MDLTYNPSTDEARMERAEQMIAAHGMDRLVFALMENAAGRGSVLTAILATENARAAGMQNSL